MQHPRGGFGHMSAFLGFSDAALMGNPKGEVWGAFLGRRNGVEKWDCILGDMPNATRNVALLEMPKYFASRFP